MLLVQKFTFYPTKKKNSELIFTTTWTKKFTYIFTVKTLLWDFFHEYVLFNVAGLTLEVTDFCYT